ncbi:hypothetical protein KP509_05G016100 [Ceratopteris richardii]|uniref:Uncharacterized protein n=1 Tax=Ceratopteris richardii TaxID=49495 RepID=A0A8T2UJN1_CERRI|nr:hypothetical protein KP509_05G016100 [Ceratopteris richardii]
MKSNQSLNHIGWLSNKRKSLQDTEKKWKDAIYTFWLFVF